MKASRHLNDHTLTNLARIACAIAVVVHTIYESCKH